ncbi:MAG: hypothetical protein D6761_01835 [Candidatus Dadabacteria bacterium]|nr:MAG: hypothetical protein D6761_01835 [Candidatus Dadabacteria bacterium]
MHVSGVRRNPETYEHVPPEAVGNDRRILVSDLAGRATMLEKLREYGIDVDPDDGRVGELLEELKEHEGQGYLYEGAEASFELLFRRRFEGLTSPYTMRGWRCIDERRGVDEPETEATVLVEVDGVREHTAASGNGPVNALDQALRKALRRFFPEIDQLRLVDYKVRVLAAGVGTEVGVRVLIESTDGHAYWGTVGVGTNVIDASYEALRDAIDYHLWRQRHGRAAGTLQQEA